MKNYIKYLYDYIRFSIVHENSDGFHAHLDAWVENRVANHDGNWNDVDWSDLLNQLHTKFGYPIGDVDMDDNIGLYIESYRYEFMVLHPHHGQCCSKVD